MRSREKILERFCESLDLRDLGALICEILEESSHSVLGVLGGSLMGFLILVVYRSCCGDRESFEDFFFRFGVAVNVGNFYTTG